MRKKRLRSSSSPCPLSSHLQSSLPSRSHARYLEYLKSSTSTGEIQESWHRSRRKQHRKFWHYPSHADDDDDDAPLLSLIILHPPPPPPSKKKQKTKNKTARLSINGLVYEAPDPTETLATFIRTRTPFTGCKIGCAEGGCGACAVLVSDAPVGGGVGNNLERRERTLNACLAPVGVLDGAAVLTSEGLKDSCGEDGSGSSVICPSKAGVGGGRFHAVHDALAERHASQCGFCTPGMAIACAAAARRRAKACAAGAGGASANGHAANGNSSSSSNGGENGEDGDAEDASGDADVSRDLDGNLCRCTGYRSIVDAARSIAPQDVEDVGRKLAPPAELAAAVAARAADASPTGMLLLAPFDASASAGSISPLSPGTTWRSPRSLDEVRAAVKERPNNVRFVAGNTGSGVYKQRLCWPPAPGTAVVSLQNVRELRKGVEVCDKDGSVVISGGTTIAELADWAWSSSSSSSCATTTATKPSRSARTWRELSRALRRVAGAHVRAAATLGGNLALAADPALALESDVATLLGALGAEVEVLETASAAASESKTLSVLDLVSGSNALSPTSLILSVRIPPSSADGKNKKKERFFATRVAARYSHAVASLQLAVSVSEDAEAGKLSDAVVVLAFHRKVSSSSSSSGGGRWRAARLRDTEAALEGASTSDPGALAAALRAARAAGLEEALADDHDREDEDGSAPAQQHANFISGAAEGALAQAVAPLFAAAGGGGGNGGGGGGEAAANGTPSSPSSVLPLLAQCRRLPTPRAAEGSRSWPAPDPLTAPVGAPVEKDRARLQASGEALYTSDFVLPASGLHGALVLSTRALAKLAAVDASRALAAVPGFVKFVSASDVPGSNDAALIGDRIFVPVGGDVEYVGERVGMVVAESEAAARAAAKLVDVVYEESSAPSKKPILSIAEAVERGSFYDVTADIGPTTKVHGDPDAAFAAAPHVLRGAKVSMPSQAHL